MIRAMSTTLRNADWMPNCDDINSFALSKSEHAETYTPWGSASVPMFFVMSMKNIAIQRHFLRNAFNEEAVRFELTRGFTPCRFSRPEPSAARPRLLNSAGRGGGPRTPNLRFWRPPLCQLSYSPFETFISVAVNRWQGRRASNPQPLVLETSALPIELLPSDSLLIFPPYQLLTHRPTTPQIRELFSCVLLSTYATLDAYSKCISSQQDQSKPLPSV